MLSPSAKGHFQRNENKAYISLLSMVLVSPRPLDGKALCSQVKGNRVQTVFLLTNTDEQNKKAKQRKMLTFSQACCVIIENTIAPIWTEIFRPVLVSKSNLPKVYLKLLRLQ